MKTKFTPELDTTEERVVSAFPPIGMNCLSDGHIDFPNERWCEYTGLSLGLLPTPERLKRASAEMEVRM
jgi:hypothetical protein